MNFGQWEARLEYRIDWLGYVLYLYRNTPAGREFLTEKGTIKTIKPGTALNKTDVYFCRFEDDQVQAIADAFAEQGVKTKNDHKNEGLLEATRDHLADMRRLVFTDQPTIRSEIMIPPEISDK